MSRTITKGERTRQKIVEAAAPIFNQQGYSGASFSELMEKTGLEKGGIYRHFASKEELAVAAFDYAWSEIKRNRLSKMASVPSPLDKLRKMVDSFAAKPSPVPGGCALMNTAIDADDGNPALRQHARAAMHEWLGYLESLVRAGIRAGEIDRKASPRSVASIVIATLEGSLMMSRLNSDRNALTLARKHLHSLLDSIESKKP
jgi:AcrR family transcriptional regulator